MKITEWLFGAVLVTFVLCVGCNEQPTSSGPDESPSTQLQTETAVGSSAETSSAKPSRRVTEDDLHERLRAQNPKYTGRAQFAIQEGAVRAAELRGCGLVDISALAGQPLLQLDVMDNPLEDISPLKGMPLEALYLEGTRVTDLSPLEGMEIRSLYLSRILAADIRPLKGMPLEELNMVATKVSDISALQGAPLHMVWFNDSPIKDISPLAGAPIISLTLKGTKVNDLRPVAKMPFLQRLHIGETPVTDLTPLRGLQLTRLVFTPSRIKYGLDVVRNLSSLREIGTVFGEGPDNDLTPPQQFWQAYDEGAME